MIRSLCLPMLLQIRIYEPAILIVGTRGRNLGGFQGLLPGSVSKYCLQYSPVPVIVVRPTSKREKKKKKRQADPSRKGYLDILLKSDPSTDHVLEGSSRNSLADTLVAPEAEAEAVAKAVGLPPNYLHSPDLAALNKAQPTKSDVTTPEALSPMEEASSDGARSPGVIMQSPNLTTLDSPAQSYSGSSEDEGDGQDDVSDGEGKFGNLRDSLDEGTRTAGSHH